MELVHDVVRIVYIYGEAEHSQFKYLLVDAAAAAAVASRRCDGKWCAAERVSVCTIGIVSKRRKIAIGSTRDSDKNLNM